MSSQPFSLASVSTFNGLDPNALLRLEQQLEPILVRRGDYVVREGETADALYVVISGRFAVEIASHREPITEISHGATIGEIAFFAGGTRTATVRAIRDGVLVRLTRDDFLAISEMSPAIWSTISAALAERLSAATQRMHRPGATATPAENRPTPRTIAVVGTRSGVIPPAFLASLIQVAATTPGTLVVTSSTLAEALGRTPRDDYDLTDALNDLERRYPRIIFIADAERTPWSEKAVRQADELLLVAAPLGDPVGSAVELGPLEAFALSLHRPASRRLVIIHDRKGIVQGTRHWLALREPAMHHHVALGDPAGVDSLWRFLTGRALGYVACGGGAYCSAHVGIYRAFREAGTPFDIIGGTSGGAAMGAAFAQQLDPNTIDKRIHRMFIEGRAMSRYTLPRYSLLDHAHFDMRLENEYGTTRIEDLWIPYFAVSTDLSASEVVIHRQGSLWQAIRASAAIPGLLPPFYTADGRTLVDGSVIANVPIEAMHALKRGPNIVTSFQNCARESAPVDYATLPRRRELLWRMFNPMAANPLPRAPSAATVLVRSMMSNRGGFERHIGPEDWLLVPPTPENMGALDWRRHSEVMEMAYQYARSELAQRPA